MRVFSVEMLVKEEGAAVVQAALNRLKKETQAVAAEMKTTSQAVTGTGAAMQTAAGKTQIAGDRAAKAAIGFAAVGNSLARTGNITADMGTRIVEAGSQISMMFGPSGLAVAALLGFASAAVTSFVRAKDEAKKMAQETQKALREMVLAGDVAQINKKLRDIQDGLLDLTTGEFTGGLDDLRKQYAALNAEIASNTAADQNRRRTVQEIEQSKERIRQLRDLEAQIKSAEASERSYLRARELAARFVQTPEGKVATGVTPSTPAVPTFPGTIGAPTTTIAPAAAIDLSKIQAAIPQASTAILDQVKKASQVLAEQIQATFQSDIANSLVSGIVTGIEQAVASGNIGEGFQAMTAMLLAGIGDAMIKFGTTTAAFAKFMGEIKTQLGLGNPEAALKFSLAMIAAGAVLKGAARSMFGGQSGGAAFTTASFGGMSLAGAGGGGGGMTLPTTQLVFGNTSATTAAGMQPRQPMQVTVIGPNDPSAQRAIQELMVKANSRGRLG